MTENFKVVEKYGNNQNIKNELEEKDGDLKIFSSSKSFLISNPSQFFKQVFLPQGYPYSVSSDYFEYQTYDTLQAFCSRITGTLTTKAILKSVGVGDATATPLAAATSWIFKDGTGMFGSIVFAWWKGTEFDCDCKKWRLFADILNDSAMFIEMLLPVLPGTTFFLCLTTAMKAGVGVSGSATRAAITQHQAVKGNMADVSAKDGSQETAVNLFASMFALLILTLIPEGRFDWLLFIVFTVLHLMANYKAVKSLRFDTLNTSRYNIVLKNIIGNGSIPKPDIVNEEESVILGIGTEDRDCFGYTISIGKSLKTQLNDTKISLNKLLRFYHNRNYVLIPNVQQRQIGIFLYENETPQTVLTAYFHAAILGALLSNRKVPKELTKFIGGINDPIKLSQSILTFIDDTNVIDKLNKKGWKTDQHSIKMDDWRLKTNK